MLRLYPVIFLAFGGPSLRTAPFIPLANGGDSPALLTKGKTVYIGKLLREWNLNVLTTKTETAIM